MGWAREAVALEKEKIRLYFSKAMGLEGICI